MAVDTSYLTTQVTTIVGQLHGIFDEIGTPRNEREARETELFAALSETLHNQLRVVNAEKNGLAEEANKIIKTIRQMEKSLDDNKGSHDYDSGGLRVTYPLNRCIEKLKEKLHTVSKLHRERFEQVKKLVEALGSYSSHLDPSFVKIPLPPTSSSQSCPPDFDLSSIYVTKLDNEFSRVYEEYTRRVAFVGAISEEMIKLWAELGTPQAQTDSSIVKYYRDAPEQLGLHESDLASLKGKRDKLIEEKKGRERRLKELRTAVEGLWDRLGVEEPDKKGFLAANRGCGVRTINEFEDELARLNELKRQNLHLFVEDARCRLQELWDALYYSEEEMLDFTPAFSDVYSDALLEAHESEIERLQVLREQRAPTLALIDKHRSLINDREALAASANDASRLMGRGTKGEKRDPTRLLREEKMRKRIAKDLPKLESELRKTLEQWEDEYGRPFLVHGERYLDEIAAAQAKAPPPRSKTPSGLPPSRNNSKNSNTGPSRPGSAMRGPAPPRSGAKTPVSGGTIRRNPLNSSTNMGPPPTKTSPSKIPSRQPLGLGHGNSSPERRTQLPQPVSATKAQPTTIRRMGPPRAPPPKMRDLFVPPDQTPQGGYEDSFQRAPSVLSSTTSSSSNIVRPISPEDVYDDRIERMSYMSASLLNRDRQEGQMSSRPPGAASNYHDFHRSVQRSYAPMRNMAPPTSRQISNQSGSSQLTENTATTGASGSENWESYEDDESVVPERDVRDEYYNKVRAATKRPFGVENGYGVPPLKVRNVNPGMRNDTVVEVEGEGHRIFSGSEAGWTDDTNA